MSGIPLDCRDGCGPPPYAGLTDCDLGDDEWLFLTPAAQFLQEYVFFTDPTYATTNLVVSRRRGASGFADVELECLGTIGGWKKVGTGDDFEVAHVELVRSNVAAGACTTSRHHAWSQGAFGIVAWGTDWASSYGYPVGGNLGAINDVVIVPEPK